MTTYLENMASSCVGNWEMSFFHLQERLNQVLMEKKKESRSGMEIMNLLQVLVCQWIVVKFFFSRKHFIIGLCSVCVNRKKGDNVEHGTGRRLTMISIKKLYEV